MALESPAQRDYYLGRALHLAVVAALGGFLFGFDTSVINGAVNPMSEAFGTGALLTGFVVSSALLGCVIGAYVAGRLAEHFGRIRVMLLASAFFTASALGSGFAFGPWDMIFWRMLGGLAVGAASVIAPAYNEEKTIIDNVDSMLGLDYPLFEVVIVNDGSRDSTLDKLIEHYELVEVPFAYIERIKTQPFRRVLKSTNPEYHRLIVVDKENVAPEIAAV